MAKQTAHYAAYLTETVDVTSHGGALLVTVNAEGKPNVMTIGWATFGWIWGKPVLTVLVRPSRYTYGYLEEVPEFTVNVPTKDLAETVAYCGAVSGRDVDKFAERGLTAVSARHVRAPIIDQCAIHYECRVVHTYDLLPDALAPGIVASAYPTGDFHRAYVGEIVSVLADADAVGTMRSPAAR